MKAVKKRVEIDWFDPSNVKELKEWVKSLGDKFEDNFVETSKSFVGKKLFVKTLEGTSYEVTDKDLIIRGVEGEYYPCKKDIFEKTYDNSSLSKMQIFTDIKEEVKDEISIQDFATALFKANKLKMSSMREVHEWVDKFKN